MAHLKFNYGKCFTECVYCSCTGEKLQFVFRNINPSHQDSAYVVTMGIKEDRSYQSKLHCMSTHCTIIVKTCVF